MTNCFKCGKILPGNLRPGEYVMCKECDEKWHKTEEAVNKDIVEVMRKNVMDLKPFGWVFLPKAKDALTIKVDRKEIVLCRECEEYKEWDGSKICMRLGSYYGNMKPNDYCSYGVRKDGDV